MKAVVRVCTTYCVVAITPKGVQARNVVDGQPARHVPRRGASDRTPGVRRSSHPCEHRPREPFLDPVDARSPGERRPDGECQLVAPFAERDDVEQHPQPAAAGLAFLNDPMRFTYGATRGNGITRNETSLNPS